MDMDIEITRQKLAGIQHSKLDRPSDRVRFKNRNCAKFSEQIMR